MNNRPMILKSALFSAVAGVSALLGGAAVASAQDLLPRDNGLATYHESPRWRESEEHPLRVLGYVLHPIGWVAREAVFRPLSYAIGSSETSRSVFGFREPFDYREPQCFSAIGVPDCRKMSPMNQLGGREEEAVSDGGMAVGERQVYFPDVNFDFNKSTLNDLGKGRVRQISQLLASVPSLKVVVEGHTDYKGSDDYNVKLGQSRAESVAKELSELGVDPARMSPLSMGESKPVFTEEEDWARAVNRRVQFSVKGDSLPAAESAKK